MMTADGSHLIYRNTHKSNLSLCMERDGHACYIVEPRDNAADDLALGPTWTVEFDDGVRLTAFGEELFLP